MYTLDWIAIRKGYDQLPFPTWQHFKLLKDEIEQQRQIDTAQIIEEEQKEEQNQAQLARMQEWETLDFMYQQTQSNTT